MKWVARLAVLLLAGCAATTAPTPAPPPQAADPLDAIAADYVRLQLEIGERDEGYVDAYYGPAEWREAARANPRTVPELAEAVAELRGRLAAVTVMAGSPEARRIAFLMAQQRPVTADEIHEAVEGYRRYLAMATEKDVDFATYMSTRQFKPLVPGQTSYWQNYRKFMVSFQKAMWGDNARADNDWAYDTVDAPRYRSLAAFIADLLSAARSAP